MERSTRSCHPLDLAPSPSRGGLGWGEGSPGFKVRRYDREYAVRIGKHVTVRKTHDDKTATIEVVIARRIIGNSHVCAMRLPINLDNQTRGDADKVHVIAAQLELSAKVPASLAPGLGQRPERPLGSRRLASQFS